MCRRRCGRRGWPGQQPAAARGAPYSKRVQATALAQVGSGGAAFVASLACHFDQCFAGFLAVGTWTGAFYAANGFLALASSRGGRGRVAISSMVLSLLAAMLGLMAIGMGVVGILVESDLRRYVAGSADFQQDWYMASRCRGISRRIFLHVVAVAAHAVQILASSFQSVFAFQRYVFFEATAAAADTVEFGSSAKFGGGGGGGGGGSESTAKLAPECIPLKAMGSAALDDAQLSPARQPLLPMVQEGQQAAAGSGVIHNSFSRAGNSPQLGSPRLPAMRLGGGSFQAHCYDRSVSVSSCNTNSAANWSPSVSTGRTPSRCPQAAT